MGLFDGLGTGFLTGGMSLVGSMMSASSSSKAMSKQLKWMSAMARKRHQLEVIDLKKAGLNPILSAMGGSGASVGTPSILPRNYGDLGASEFLEGITAAKQLKLLDAQIDQIKQATIETKNKAVSAKAQSVLDTIAAERETRTFAQIDNSSVGKSLMPLGRDLPDGWIKTVLQAASAILPSIPQPTSGKQLNVTPLTGPQKWEELKGWPEWLKIGPPPIGKMDWLGPSNSAKTEQTKKSRKEQIESAYDKAMKIYDRRNQK